MTKPHWLESREIVERIIIQGDLILETPAGFGSGDSGSLVDIPLLLDPLENCALLTGASLAGALRSYLRERECGYWGEGGKGSLYSTLFGIQEDDGGEQSLLIVCDSIGDKPSVELRDGVKIDPRTRTAQDKNKFDFELIAAGSVFRIRMELLIRENKRDDLIRGMAIALQGLEQGEISLGVRKRRGFGRCRVRGWNVCRYDLTEPKGLIGWLKNDKKEEREPESDISKLLGATDTDTDNRNSFTVNATFSLDGSLLIRSDFDDVNAPDSVHLKSKRGERAVPVLSGTSLAGALRARALRIANTVSKNGNGRDMVEELFGSDIKNVHSDDELFASRFITAETEIIKPLDIVQSRVKIDRFTGGSFPSALFSEQPVFGQEGTGIRVNIMIQQPEDAEIGLTLLLLKDIWTGDLPLGGEIGVGRGRLRGRTATLVLKKANSKSREWTINQAKGQLDIDGDPGSLEDFVQAFCKEMQR
ncbi:MAG: hypothetical protein C4B59_12120 [Candidatus Methanogaster sp.]|uniref:Uncharacterized protein n=1 Tax=Candidatus Methanogaster sp. TaxID=3386292 RepID=A0AC61L0Y6_9EURY|nr:MAG: hypothetical protein C4B59_12120 [ANME-2 cluster archaeon]